MCLSPQNRGSIGARGRSERLSICRPGGLAPAADHSTPSAMTTLPTQLFVRNGKTF
jgi:hypothetical protein